MRAHRERQVAPIPRTRASSKTDPDPTVIPDNPNWHRFKMACPFYRERWMGDGEEHDRVGRVRRKSRERRGNCLGSTLLAKGNRLFRVQFGCVAFAGSITQSGCTHQ